MGKFLKMGFWSFHELGACQSGLVCTAELVFDSSFQGYPTCLCSQPIARWPYGHIWPYLAIFGYLWPYGHMAMREKDRHVGYPWKELSKCGPEMLIRHLQDTPGRIYNQYLILAYSPLVLPGYMKGCGAIDQISSLNAENLLFGLLLYKHSGC